MKHARRCAATAAAATLLSVLGAAGAQAAPTFHCEASALRAAVGGQPGVEPVTTGRSGDCATAAATPALALPALLDAQALIATTAYDGAARSGGATAGIARLRVLPVDLPPLPIDQALQQLPPLTVTIPALPLPLPPLPGLPALPGATAVPTTLQLDIRDAVRALLAAPPALLEADVLTADAAVSCAGGAPQLSGTSRVAGVRVLGQELPVDGVVDQVLPLIDTQHISPSQLDPNKVQIPGVGPIPAGPLKDAIATALAALTTPIALPELPVHVRLVPSEQLRTGGELTQRALRAEIAVVGQPVLDAVFGEAKVAAGDGACAVPAAPKPVPPPAAVAAKPAAPAAAGVAAQGVADQILACSDRKLVLVDVLRRGRRVKLLGAANRRYVGRNVAIRLRATGEVVAHARVRKDGSFQTTAPMPARAFFASHKRANLVRYRAEIGRELSLPLKLQRRLIVSSLTSRKGRVTVAGRVVLPLTTPVAEIRLVRRVSCHKVVLVKRFKPRGDGTFRVTVKAPKGQTAAVYRMVTQVREKLTNPRSYPTFTLPRGVALSTR